MQGALIELVTQLYAWMREETLESLLPKDDLIELFAELRQNPDNLVMLRDELDLVWMKLTERLASETRSTRQILGDENTAELLEYAGNVDSVYDPVTIKALLGAPVFESMIGGVLYEAIFMVSLLLNAFHRLKNTHLYCISLHLFPFRLERICCSVFAAGRFDREYHQ